MPQNRTQGFNDDGESQWFEGGHIPEGWHKQDPTKATPTAPEPDPQPSLFDQKEATPEAASPDKVEPEQSEEPENATAPEPDPKADKKKPSKKKG